jgi:hypothetical protein
MNHCQEREWAGEPSNKKPGPLRSNAWPLALWTLAIGGALLINAIFGTR